MKPEPRSSLAAPAFGVTSGPLARQRTGCMVVGVHAGRELSVSAKALDTTSAGAIERVLGRGDLEGELGTTLLLHDVPEIAAERVLLVGLGPAAEFRERAYLAALAAAMAALRKTGAASTTLCLDELHVAGREFDWKIEQAVLAVMEGLYRPGPLKQHSAGDEPALAHVFFHVADPSASACQAAIERGVAIAEGIALARDLGNLPANLCTPTYLAEQALALGQRHGWRVRILEQNEIEQLGMNGFLAVARGSRQPPKFIVMECHGGARDAKPVVLVGKGITFDAGGISMKPAPEMDEMKFDMCGAAGVFGALHAAALLKLPLNIVGLVPATENMPDGNAVKPGDVVTTMSGLSVEILDTDSEGRLVLCEALTYAERYAPAAVVDVATLTGEIVRALGEVATGLFANDDALARELLAAGERAWDRAWQMPLWDEYQEALKSNFADVPNIGTGVDSASTAACFLSRFTGKYPWVHLDIAGTASKGGAQKGATGRPVGLLVEFLLGRVGRA